MTDKHTLRWSTLTLMAAAIPLVNHGYRQLAYVDTEAMLDVSVSIKTVSHVSTDKVGDSVWKSGVGSGFLVSSERCEVWTNQHVVDNAAMIEVYPRGWAGNTGIPASIVNATTRNDIAVLKLERCDGVRQAALGNSNDMEVGDDTYAIGNPLGRNPDSVSRGILSHKRRYVDGVNPYLQTDAVIHQGNSGGALFNRRGEVIGMNTAVAVNGNTLGVGVSYALPINLVKRVTSRLRQNVLGWGDAGIRDIISELAPHDAEILGVPEGHAGVILTRAPDGGACAGKLKKHDVIFSVAGKGFRNAAQLLRRISNRAPGTAVTFSVLREGEIRTVEITLSDGRPASAENDPEYYDGYLGIAVEMWDKEELTPTVFETPVITKVFGLSPAHSARIASSQKTIGQRGPFMFPVLLDVKTITGAAFDGSFRRIESVADLEALAEQAFRARKPVLLEIELWSRKNPYDMEAPLQHVRTSFHRVLPAQSTAAAPGSEDIGEQVFEQGVESVASTAIEN